MPRRMRAFLADGTPSPPGWTVWESDGTAWLAARPDDPVSAGDLIGWRYAAGAGEPPGRGWMTYVEQCAGPSDSLREAAVVIDFGDAQRGERPPAPVRACVRVDEGATAAQVPAKVAEVRTGARGEVAAVNGYPAAPPPGPPVPLLAGGVAVLILLAAVVLLAVRRRA
ncbi:GPS-CTERM domain-containing protein [Nonomuraea typhae]|uniref:GPS-CTERM domain-containing protein n=1 Tax=Nonomuraea typhae TaxID=2603600 RepID=UPI0012FA6E62|nr:GPS-CTERM domain-containing protein [Nonomuraea typhae]